MKCKTCGIEKLETEFYSSNKSRCKECVRLSAKQYRIEKIEHYRAYDNARASMPHRVKARLEYQKTDRFKESHSKANRKNRNLFKERATARNKVAAALKAGRMHKLPCLICGLDAEAHHPDYSRPLDVIWLCNKHHREAHDLSKQTFHRNENASSDKNRND